MLSLLCYTWEVLDQKLGLVFGVLWSLPLPPPLPSHTHTPMKVLCYMVGFFLFLEGGIEFCYPEVSFLLSSPYPTKFLKSSESTKNQPTTCCWLKIQKLITKTLLFHAGQQKFSLSISKNNTNLGIYIIQTSLL